MKKRKGIAWRAGIAAAAGAVLVLAAAAVRSKENAPPVREIVLSARGVAFGKGNPTIEASPGERIRFVVRNDDTGVVHAISVPLLDPNVKDVVWGEEVALEVTAGAPGTYEYVCTHHYPLMKGKLVVR